MSCRRWSVSRLQCTSTRSRRWTKAMRTSTTSTTSVTLLHLKLKTFRNHMHNNKKRLRADGKFYNLTTVFIHDVCLTVDDREIVIG